MGALACAVWRHVRGTRDLVLLVEHREGAPDTLLRSFSNAGFRTNDHPALRSLGPLRTIRLEDDSQDAFVSIPTDVLLVDSEYHRVALQRRVPYRLSDESGEVMVLACEDLILHKLLAGRIIDRADAAALIRANRDTLDVPYLCRWARELAAEPELDEVWCEACPDDQLPGP